MKTVRFAHVRSLLASILAVLVIAELHSQTITSGEIFNGTNQTGNYSAASSITFTAENGAVFSSGTTTLAGGNTVFLSGSSSLTLDASEIWNESGSLNIYAQTSGASFTNNGAMNLLGGDIYGGGQTGFTLTNAGTITNGGSSNTSLYLANGTGDTLMNTGTILSTSTTGNYSQVLIGWSGSGTTINNNGGTIEANGPNSSVYLGYNSTPLTFSNTGGTITAANGGTVYFYGTFTNAELAAGTINGSGGTLALDGTLNLTGALSASTDGTAYTLDGGTVSGGSAANSALRFSTSGGTLNNVSLTGNYSVGSNDSFTLDGTSHFTGNVTFAGGNNVYLGTASATTTIPSGTTWQADSTLNIVAQATNVTLSNQGTLNTLGGDIYGSQAGFTLNNSGTITNGNGAASTNSTLYIANGSGDTLTNSGAITAYSTAGNYSTVALGWTGSSTTVTNTGTITSNGPNSLVYLGYNGSAFNFSNTGGTITAENGGAVDFYGSFTSAQLAEGTINGSGGALNIDGVVNNTSLAAPASGVFTLYGGTINGGTVTSNALQFSSSGGTLNAVDVSGAYTMPANSFFRVAGTTTLSGGTETWAGGNSIYAGAASATLSNTGTVTSLGGTIGGDGYTGFTVNNSGSITNGTGASGTNTTLYLTNYGGDTLLNSGTITAYSTAGNYSNVYIGYSGAATTLTNTGSLISNGPNSSLVLGYSSNPFTYSNTGGTITAENGGGVYFYGTFTSAELAEGTINGAGGSLNIDGTVNNTSLAAPASGVFTLDSGTINGGTVTNNALQFSTSGGTLNGVDVSGNYTMPVNSYFRVAGTTTLSGGTETWAGGNSIYAGAAGATLSNTGTVTSLGGNIGGDGYTGFTLNNSGSITNGTGASGTNTSLYLADYGGDTLLNSGTITAYSTAGNYSNVYIGYSGTATTLTNTGSLISNGPNSSLVLGYNSTPFTYSNTGGIITAENGGAVDFYGLFTSAELAEGTINGAGGTLNIDGTVNNTSLAAPASGVFTLYGGTINGGTVTNNALQFSTSGGTLNGVDVSGAYTMPVNSYFRVQGTTTLSGGMETWAGNNNIFAGAAGATLSNTGVVTSLGGTIAGDGYTGFTLNNSGSITNGTGASGTNTSLFLANYGGDTILNSGTIQAYSTAGNYSNVYIGYSGTAGTLTNTGNLISNGPNSSIVLGYNSNPFTYSNTGGTITAENGGTVDFYGAFTSAELNEGTINGAGGTLNLNGTVTNTALAAPATGVFTLYGGTINGGTVANNALQFSTSAGTLNGVDVLGAYTMPVNSYFYVKGTTTLGGTGTWEGNNEIYAGAASATLVNSGTINSLGGQISGAGQTGFTFNNQGTVSNGGSGDTTLNLGNYANDTVMNSGTIQSVSTTGNDSNVIIGSSSAGTFTNTGTVLANGANAAVQIGTYVANSAATNLASNTLTGGTWGASNGGTLQFLGTSNAIVTNAATIELSGAGSTIETASGASDAFQTVQQKLTTNNGTLDLTNYTYTSSNALTNNGTINLSGATLTAPSITNAVGGYIGGTGSVSDPTNAGTIEAKPGTLSFSNGIQGPTGTVIVDSGATLSLSSGTTASSAGTLNQNGTLALGSNNFTVSSSYTNDNFGTGNSFNPRAGVTGTGEILAAGNVTQVITGADVVNGSTSTPELVGFGNVRLGGSVTLDYSVMNGGTTGPAITGALQTDVNGGNITDSRLSGTGVTAGNYGPLAPGASQTFAVTLNGTTAGAVAAGQTINIESNFSNVASQTLTLGGGAVYQPAEATISPTSPINLGNTRIGGTLDQALTITNSAPATGGYTETLGANVTGTTGSATTAGSISGLAQGASSAAISVGLNTGTAGAISGSATLGLSTQAINGSGLGTASIGSQTVNVTGNVYQEAQASTLPTTVDVGNFHVGSGATQALTISNVAPATGGYTETLGGSVTGTTGAASASGSFSGVAQGASSSAITVGVNSSTGGTVSGTATLGFETEAINGSGLGTASVGSQTINVTGKAYNLASASLGTINFGNVLEGSAAAQFLSVMNTAPTGGYSEGLNASLGAFSGTGASLLSGSGSIVNLAAGLTNFNTLDVTLNTSSTGTISAMVSVNLASNGLGTSGLGITPLSSQSTTITGEITAQVGTLASASAATPNPVNLGAVRIGATSPTQALTISNTAVGPAEGLDASIATASPGVITASGTITSLAPQATDDTSLVVGMNTSTAGLKSGSATITLDSDGTFNHGVETALPSQTINVTGAVYQSAEANTLMTPLSLGASRIGGSLSGDLSVSNVAPNTGGYTENLGATVTGTTGSTTTTGSVVGLAQGDTSTAIGVGLGTATAGAVSGTATVAFTTNAINGSGLGSLGIGSQTVTLTGAVYQSAEATVAPTSPINLGNARIGGTLDQALTVTNSAPATGGYTENLGASVTGTTGSATGTGSITGLAQGASSTAITVGLNTGTAGAISGSATLGLSTEAINGSGLGTASIGSQTVNVTGNVYQEAEANSLTTPINLGTMRTGTVVNTTLGITNVAPNTGGYTENLGASFGATSAGLVGSGSLAGLTQGSSSSALSVAYTAGAAGSYSGTAAVNFQTEAINGSGLGNASIGSETVEFEALVNALAQNALEHTGGYTFTSTGTDSGVLNFGSQTLGSGLLGTAFELFNGATGPADSLLGSFDLAGLSGTPFTFGGSTSFNLLAGGTGLPFTLNFDTSGAGDFDATLIIDEFSHNAFQSDLELEPYELHIEGDVTSGTGVGAVPEPSAYGAAAVAMIGALLLLRRRKLILHAF